MPACMCTQIGACSDDEVAMYPTHCLNGRCMTWLGQGISRALLGTHECAAGYQGSPRYSSATHIVNFPFQNSHTLSSALRPTPPLHPQAAFHSWAGNSKRGAGSVQGRVAFPRPPTQAVLAAAALRGLRSWGCAPPPPSQARPGRPPPAPPARGR